MTPIALTIAGSDPSGGAGIQADLKTFHQRNVYGILQVDEKRFDAKGIRQLYESDTYPLGRRA